MNEILLDHKLLRMFVHKAQEYYAYECVREEAYRCVVILMQ